jgi:hypothetical protein
VSVTDAEKVIEYCEWCGHAVGFPDCRVVVWVLSCWWLLACGLVVVGECGGGLRTG